VICTFNVNPQQDGNPIYPPASDYNGLVAGATFDKNAAEIAKLKQTAQQIPGGTTGQLLGTGISTSPQKSNNAIFYNAQSKQVTIALSPSSRGTLHNFIYQWTMKYNGDTTTVPNGDHVEILFGYGDPMFSEVDS